MYLIIDFLIQQLESLIPKIYSGACWGYDFDWESRYVRIPAYHPTIVATGIITNALFICYKITGIKKAFNLCQSACNFVLKDLNRTEEDGNYWMCGSSYYLIRKQ